MNSRPNIVWISTHDINPHLGAYAGVWPGAEEAFTPRLDELAAQGARFDQAFAAAPVCSPSRSAIFTGCYPIAIGTMHMRSQAVPPPEVKLFTEYLRAAGYYASNNYSADVQFEYLPTWFDDCSAVAHWRNRPTPDAPFFAAFHSAITHESQIYLEDGDFAEHTSHVPEERRHDPEEVTLPPYYPDTPGYRRSWARYLDLITEMDHWVGTILDALDEDGLAENTIVVFWSDHGVGMPRAKRWAHEAGLHEPLVIRWPARIPAGTVRREVVQLLDLAPTMLAAAGLPVPEHMHGRPILDDAGEFAEADGYAFGARDRMMDDVDVIRTVRDERFRYICNYRPDHPGMGYQHYAEKFVTWGDLRRLNYEESWQLGTGSLPSRLTPLQRSVVAPYKAKEELYDVLSDPHETRNLAEDPAYAEKLAELRDVLDGWMALCDDKGMIPERELIERWRPGGDKRRTEAPTVTVEDGLLVASCATPGASIGWVAEPPVPFGPGDGSVVAESSHPAAQFDAWPKQRWNLYSGPVPRPEGDVWFRAFRLGYDPSPDVVV